MAQKGIEVILTRQLAGYLAMPILMVNPQGKLIFYNEPAEKILGRRFDETGELPAEKWLELLGVQNSASADFPLTRALKGQPGQGSLIIRSAAGQDHRWDVTCFPLLGHEGVNYGAVAIFWAASPP